MTKRYRLVLEEVTGPEDNENIEIKATWALGRNGWSVRNNIGLLASILESLKKSKAVR